jgi:hypothetical protein
MKQRNRFPFLLALAIIFASAPMTAHAAQQKDDSPPQAAQPAPPQPSPADQRDAQQIITGPYRLTYTLTEMDGSRRVGSQRYAIVLDAGRGHGPAHLQLGTKIPITTGESTIEYIDIGMSIEASLQRVANGFDLSSHVNQSALDSQQSLAKAPVIRRASLDSNVLLNEDKPVIIGTVDMPGTTHVLQIQVELTKIP